MVYCGRPSGGCYACRERKTRCDKIPEGCTQCAKAKRKCPGYRSMGDVIFHNESEKVVRKFKAKEAKDRSKKDASKASLPATISPEVDESVLDQSLEVVQYQTHVSNFTLLPTIEDRATGFFVTNFVVNTDGKSPGRLDYLSEIYRDQTLDEGLLSSMRAVGFAGYAHATQAPVLLYNARQQYAQALKHTNNALQSPEDATKDTTLLSILVLGIFETITGCKQRSLKDWSEHINGAAAVVKLRGADQIKTTAGRRMLIQVTSNLLITSLARGTPVPDFICKFVDEAMKLAPRPEPGLLVQKTMIAVTQLRAEMLRGTLKDPQIIMAKSLELDGVLLEITENPPPGWEYETVYTDIDSPYIYHGRYHIYHDCSIAQIWNALRVVRVLLHEQIRSVLIKGFTSKPPLFSFPVHTAQFQLSTDTLYTLLNDILSSIPQHLIPLTTSSKTFPDLSPKSIDPDYGYRYADGNFPVIRMYGASFLLWPLWFTGVMDVSTEEVRTFVVRNLRAIGDTMGINQAHILAAVLEARSEMNVFL